MKAIYALEGGLAGAAALTLIHETIKKALPGAPRFDLLGIQAVSKGIKALNAKQPGDRKLYGMAMAADLISNALYYSLSGIGGSKGSITKGAVLGLGAGLSAVLLPAKIGLSEHHTNRSIETRILTVGLYVLGGIVASVVLKKLDNRKRNQHQKWQHRLVTSSQA